MATLGRWSGGAVSVYPSTTEAAPNGLFPTQERNDGSAYTFTSSTSTLTLPSSDLADGYLIVAAVEIESSHNNRMPARGRITQASGTGTFVGGRSGGYSRDASEDRCYIRCWGFIDNPSASATFQFQWERDVGDGTPAGATVRSEFQVIPFYYSDVGLYTSSSSTASGGTSPVVVTGFSGTDGTNITISSNVVSVTGDNKRYVVLGSQYWEGTGNTRTQRWAGLDIDGTQVDDAKACIYLRDNGTDENGGHFTHMIETVTATRTIEQTTYRGDGISNLQGGADVDGTVAASFGDHSLVVIELNDSAEVFQNVADAQSSLLATTGPVDLSIATTTGITFNDSASWTRASDTGMNAVQTCDGLFGANIAVASNSVGDTERWTAFAELTVNGTEDTDSFHGNYMRNNQGAADTFGWSANLLGFQALTAGDDVGVSVTELTGSEGGGAGVSPANWTGFWGINLDTMSGGASTVTATTSADAAVSDTKTATASLNAAVSTSISATGSLDGIVAKTFSATGSLNAAVSAIRQATASLDAQVIGTSIVTASVSLNALVVTGTADWTPWASAIAHMQHWQMPAIYPNGAMDVGDTQHAYWTFAGISTSPGATVTATLSLAAAIQKSLTATASLNAAVSTTRTAAASLDGAVARAQTAATDLDAAVQALQTATLGADAAVSATNSLISSLDAAVSATRTAIANLDAAIAEGKALNISIDAAIATDRSVSVSLSAAIQLAQTLTLSLNAAVSQVRTLSVGVDATIKLENIVSTTDLDAAVSSVVAIVTSLDAYVAALTTVTASFDAAVERAVTVTTSLDAQVTFSGTALRSASIDAAVQTMVDASASLDAYVAQMRTLNAQIDAVVSATVTDTAQLDAVVQAFRTQTASFDAAVSALATHDMVVDAAVQTTGTATANLDAVIAGLASGQIGLDAAVQALRSASASIDAYVRKTITASLDVDAWVAAGQSAGVDVDAAIAQLVSGSISIDVFVSGFETVTTDLSAAVQRLRSAETQIDGYVQKLATLSLSIDAYIARQFDAGVNLDSYVALTRVRSANLDAGVAIARSAGVSVGSAVQALVAASVSLDSYIALGSEIQASIDAWVAITQSQTVDLEALLQKTIDASTDLDVYVLAALVNPDPRRVYKAYGGRGFESDRLSTFKAYGGRSSAAGTGRGFKVPPRGTTGIQR